MAATCPVPKAAIVRKTDPRTKILAAAASSIICLRADIWGLTALTVAIVSILLLGRVSLRGAYRACKPALPFIAVVFLFHLLFSPHPSATGLSLGPFSVNTSGFTQGGILSWRLTILIAIGGLLTVTTSPTDLTRGIEKLLYPVTIVRVSPHDVALMLSLALRFIPTVQREAAIVRDAQAARGARLETGNLGRRLVAVASLAVPLCLAVFRRCDDLVVAMEARGYQGGPRTGMYELKLTTVDVVILVAVSLATVAVLCT